MNFFSFCHHCQRHVFIIIAVKGINIFSCVYWVLVLRLKLGFFNKNAWLDGFWSFFIRMSTARYCTNEVHIEAKNLQIYRFKDLQQLAEGHSLSLAYRLGTVSRRT